MRALIIIYGILALSMAPPSFAQELKDANGVSPVNGTWLVHKIGGIEVINAVDGNKIPQIEIQVSAMEVQGNDGCNRIAGSVETLNEKQIEFGTMAGTRMICPDMETSSRFLTAMDKVSGYNLSNSNLTMFDEGNIELLQFKRIE